MKRYFWRNKITSSIMISSTGNSEDEAWSMLVAYGYVSTFYKKVWELVEWRTESKGGM